VSRVERVLLVGCVKTKHKGRHAAKDLYASPLFAKRRAYAEASGRQWFILSAEHGLVDPDQPLDPYERTLNRMSADERAAWGRRVVRAIGERLGDLETKILEVHAGSRYVNAIEDEIGEAGGTVTVPLAKLGLGKQLSWYGDHQRGSPVRDDAHLRAARLENWSAGGEDESNSLSGTIEWTGHDWLVTGTADWLLDEYKAVLPSGNGVRPVAPSEGIPYLYAVFYSLRATYTWVSLIDAGGKALDQESLISELESLRR
jgi:hypothetical protein